MPYCNSCDVFLDTDTDDYRETPYGDIYCPDCDPTIVSDLIHNYSYRPRPFNAKGNFPDEVLMGVELEVGGGQVDIARAVKRIDPREDHLYCKQDCSIYGVEIVTHPMTLAYAREYPFSTLLASLRDRGCYTDREDCQCGDYCDHEYGLHIHVSRNAFRQARRVARSEPVLPVESYEQRIGRQLRELRRREREQLAITHQMTWLMFLERNADMLGREAGLARRDPEHYGPFRKSDLSQIRAKATQPYFDESRYTAINCQGEKTYEMRFFKSTIDTEEFYAAIEFADASVEFTRKLDPNKVLRNGTLHWSSFVGWLEGRNYPNLSSQIVNLGITE